MVYLHFDQFECCYSIIRKGCAATRPFHHKSEDWISLLNRDCTESNILVVADGSNEIALNSCLSVCVSTNTEIILCTSFQFLKFNTENMVKYKPKIHTMPAWSRVDLEIACKLDCFNFQCDELNENILRRY